MAAKKRKPEFDVPSSGQPDAGWVSRSDKGAAKPSAPSVPAPASTPVTESLEAGTGVVQRSSAETYTRLPVVASPQRLEGNKMSETNNPTGGQTPGTLLVNGVKVLGEVAIVPGASLIVDGQVKSGIFHAAGGVLGIALLGPVLGPLTWLAFGADSYSRSVSGKTLVDQFSNKPKLAV
jgi:hypothetical protein